MTNVLSISSDVLYTSNNANLVLEYRHGIDILRFMESRKRNLFARLAPEDAGSMPEQFVRSIARDVLHALVGIHARGLMHRDVKLDNILISPHSGTCDVIDFNLASPMFQEGTAEELVYTKPAGSLHYCAPSILQTCIGKGPGYSARGGWLDVYSLGVACYAMLVGRFPFPGQSAKDILAAHTKKGGRCFGGETAPAGVSSLAINFIETCVDVGLGLKADEALMHPWLAEF